MVCRSICNFPVMGGFFTASPCCRPTRPESRPDREGTFHGEGSRRYRVAEVKGCWSAEEDAELVRWAGIVQHD